MFFITVWTAKDHDLAYEVRADSAPEMEDAVTRLHKEFPAPSFLLEVTS